MKKSIGYLSLHKPAFHSLIFKLFYEQLLSCALFQLTKLIYLLIRAFRLPPTYLFNMYHHGSNTHIASIKSIIKNPIQRKAFFMNLQLCLSSSERSYTQSARHFPSQSSILQPIACRTGNYIFSNSANSESLVITLVLFLSIFEVALGTDAFHRVCQVFHQKCFDPLAFPVSDLADLQYK